MVLSSLSESAGSLEIFGSVIFSLEPVGCQPYEFSLSNFELFEELITAVGC